MRDGKGMICALDCTAGFDVTNWAAQQASWQKRQGADNANSLGLCVIYKDKTEGSGITELSTHGGTNTDYATKTPETTALHTAALLSFC